MSSINLSFKEWQFLSFNQNQAIKESTMSTSEIEKLKSALPLNFMPSLNILEFGTPQQLYASKSKDDITYNILSNNNSANKKHFYHLSSWGRCELFACTYKSCLSIFSYDDNQCMTPIFMFSPYEKYSIGKIKKHPSKSSRITALGWSNGYLQPCISMPILAVSSEKGHVIIFDLSSKSMISNLFLNDLIISLLWSSYRKGIFYAGSNTGRIYICEFDGKSAQVIKSFDFWVNSNESSEKVSKSVDFITQNDSDGLTVAIASKDGAVGIITNLNEPKDSKLHVFQIIDFCEIKQNSEFEVSYFEFYPNSHDFILFASKSSTFLISTTKTVLIPFIPTSNSKFISLIENENDKVVVGYDNEIAIWKLAGKMWIRSFVLKIGHKFGVSEILTFSKHDDKILLTTASNWLTEIEYKRNKLFVTKRIKLIDGHLVDFSLGDGSIAFLNDNNSISITSFTSESKFSVENQDMSDDNSQNIHGSEESMTDDLSEVPLFSDNDATDTFSESSNENEETMIKSNSSESNLARSESDNLSKNSSFQFSSNELLCGNSNSIAYAFNIEKDDMNSKMQKIEWISSQKVIAWCEKKFYLIDLQMRCVTRPLKNKFDRKSVTITHIFFTKSRKIMCMILNHKQVYFIDTESNFNVINSIDFSELLKKGCNFLHGSFSPKEDEVVFASQNRLFFVNLNEKEESVKRVFSKFEYEASFISWKRFGILIGTERGSAFLITNTKLSHVRNVSKMKNRDLKVIYNYAHNSNKMKFGSIQQILSCSNKSYIITDSTNHGIIVSNKVQQIASNIKILKQNSEDIFLVYLQNYNKIVVINPLEDFAPLQPPSFYLAKKNNIGFKSLNLKEDLKNDKNLMIEIEKNLSILNFSISYKNSFLLLNQVISFYDQFSSLASKTFLKLGHLEKARNLLLTTNPNDGDYLNNVMLAALYESNSESAQLAVKNLISNNQVNQAIDILLMINKNYIAAEVLFKFGRNKEAYCILMMLDKKEDERMIAKKIANSLISQKDNVLCGLKLLSSYGYEQELINQISLNL